MSEEDLQHDELVRWMKTKKRITVKEVRTYINSTLFENETGDLSRLLSTYQVTLSVSLSTTQVYGFQYWPRGGGIPRKGGGVLRHPRSRGQKRNMQLARQFSRVST